MRAHARDGVDTTTPPRSRHGVNLYKNASAVVVVELPQLPEDDPQKR